MKLKIFLLIFVLSLFAPALLTSAKNHQYDAISNLPEQAGTYDVPGHPGMKLRVFVYHAKGNNPGKPGPVAPPQQTCSSTNLLDPDSNSVVSPASWKLPNAWSYNLNPASVPSTVGGDKLLTIAANSFKAWSDQAGSAVTITEGPTTLIAKAARDFKNIIAWGRAPGTALAVSYIWYQNGTALEIDTVFNKNFTWYWSDPSRWNGQTCAYAGVYDAQNILTHELGHTFGLDDEYADEYANNTMYGYGSKGETKKNTLTNGDITGVTNIY